MSTPVKPAKVSTRVKEMEKDFVKEDATSLLGGTKNMDKFEDLDSDGQSSPVDGQTLMAAGKYNGKLGLAEIYVSDKSYIEWVRNHATRQSVESIKKLLVYRDTEAQKGYSEKDTAWRPMRQPQARPGQ